MWFTLITHSWIEKNYLDKHGEVEVHRHFLDSLGVGLFLVTLQGLFVYLYWRKLDFWSILCKHTKKPC